MKYFVIGLLILMLIIVGGWWLTQPSETVVVPGENDGEMLPVEPNGGIGDGATPLDELATADRANRGPESVIGSSVDGAAITAYHFGTGSEEVLLIANIHGGDAPNTEALAQEFVEYFSENPEAVPQDLSITIIPTVNPDGLSDSSRFNQNNVDLNRNFACDWAAESRWRDQTVSGGSAAFSEPEAKAIRNYVNDASIAAAIVYFAAEGKVYPSACEGSPSKDAIELAATYALAANYPTEAEFDAYEINGDMVNWLANLGIPAISVLLTDRSNTEWRKNLAGVEAVLAEYADQSSDEDD